MCLPDDDDLTVDLPAENRTGTVVGWGFDTVFYKETQCGYKEGLFDTSSLPSKLKEIDLK